MDELANLANGGDVEAIWDRFMDRYRRVVFAAIQRLAPGEDAVMDAFAFVCEKLRADNLRRLRAFDPAAGAKFTTWITAVVRNLTIDWLRSVDGRKSAPAFFASLEPVEQSVYEKIIGSGCSFAEAYGQLKSNGAFDGSYGEFLRCVAGLYRRVVNHSPRAARELFGTNVEADLAAVSQSEALSPDDFVDVDTALARLEPDLRRAILLFVVEGFPAEKVAKMVGWPNARTVYNRVRRALAAIRDDLLNKS